MKGPYRKKNAVFLLMVASLFFCGCSRDDGALLDSYREQIEGNTYTGRAALFRE